MPGFCNTRPQRQEPGFSQKSERVPADNPTSIRLDRDVKAYLKKVCKDQGCSMLWLVADILAKWVRWHREQAKK